MTGLQQLCGFRNLRCASKRPPFCKVGRSASGSDTFRVEIGTQYFRRNQWKFRTSGRVSSSLMDSASLVNSNREPLFCGGARGTLIRPRNLLPLHGYVLDIGLGTTTALSTGFGRRKRRIQSPAIPGDGSSASASDSTLDGEGRAQDASRPSSSSSLRPPWNFTVKPVRENRISPSIVVTCHTMNE